MPITHEEILSVLTSLGLREREVITYLAIRKLKVSTISDIAEETHIKKSSLYSYTDKLQKLGLISQSTEKRLKYYKPEAADKIYLLLEQNEWKIRQIKGTADSLIAAIDQIAPSKKGSEKPEIRYFEDLEGVRLVYNEILQHDEVFACVNVSEVAKVFPENLEKFTQAVRENKMTLKEIVEQSAASNRYVAMTQSKLHKVKYLPKKRNLEVDYLIYGDYLTIIDFKAKPPVSILIKHKDIADSSRTIFTSIWKSLQDA